MTTILTNPSVFHQAKANLILVFKWQMVSAIGLVLAYTGVARVIDFVDPVMIEQHTDSLGYSVDSQGYHSCWMWQYHQQTEDRLMAIELVTSHSGMRGDREPVLPSTENVLAPLEENNDHTGVLVCTALPFESTSVAITGTAIFDGGWIKRRVTIPKMVWSIIPELNPRKVNK